MEIKSCDVLFVWGRNLIEDAIETVTHGPSHVALFLDENTLAEAQVGRESGTALLSDYSGKYLEVWRDESLTDDERQRIVEYAKSHFGIEYDYLAILAELVRFEIHIPIDSFHEGKRRICSSYVDDCVKAVGKNWSDTPYTPAPIDLLNGGKLTRKGVLPNG